MKPFDDKEEKQETSEIKTSISSSSQSPSSSVEKKWLTTKAENYLPTLMYHNISGNTPNNNYVSPENLESVLQVLQAKEIYTVSTQEAHKILTTQTKPSEKIIWLTFDDGYQDFYDSVFPLLKKYKMHATSFIITNKVKNNRAGYLTTNQIKEMSESSYVDFQSHTVSHVDLNISTAETQKSELEESKAYLDDLLQQETIALCYPAGSHNASTEPIARELGYKMGLLDPGRTYDGLIAVNAAARNSDGLFSLNRYRTFTNTDGAVVSATISEDEKYNSENTQK